MRRRSTGRTIWRSAGGILLCEDGGSNPKRLIGLSEDGQTFPFAENRIVLSEADIATIDAVFPGTQANF